MPVKEIRETSAELDAILKDVQREPVRLLKDGAEIAVMLSPEHFRALTRPSYKV